MAKVLTGISGNLISAASAGFAPTNSADVSAIASAYQVVSATATQLYAGSSYVTSVNDAPLSASRAGNAANASMATSAYYDGTGRLISALPDSAAVSAIASAYAESAASGKQDELTFSYDENDRIDGINGSALAGQGGGGGSVVSPSGTIIVTDGTAIEATNSAIGTTEGFDVNNSGQANYSNYSNLYEYLGNFNPFKARGIGLTYNSSTATRTAWVSANTDLGNLVSSFVLPASSISAGGLLSTSNIYSVWDSLLKVDGGSLTLSGTYPVLFVYPGVPYSAVKELAWASALPTYSYDSEDKISALNGSAIAGGGGGGGLVTAIGSLDGHITSINSSDIVGRPSAVMTRSADENILEADEWMSMGPNTTEGRQFSYSQGINKVYLEPDHTSNGMSATAYDDYGNAVGVVPLTATAFTISSDTAIITRVDANSDENGLSMFISGFRYIPSGDYIAALPSIDACVLKSSTVVQLGTAATADTGNGIAFAQGLASAGNNGFAFGFYAEAENGVAFGNGATGKFSSLAAGTSVSAYSCSMAVGGGATADYVSMAQGQYVSAYDNSFARGSYVSAVNSATVLGQYNLSGDGYGSSGAAFVLGDGMASYARHDLMVVTKDGEITMYSGTADTTGTGIMSSIRALSANAGGVDSATVSAIASSYAESAVSSYQPLSGMSGYASAFSAGEGLEFVQSGSDQVLQVEAPVDIVAGPGIVIDNPDGNTLRVSTEADAETVLYQAATNEGTTLQLDQYVTLAESMTHFERVRIYYALQKAWAGKQVFECYMVDGDVKVNLHDVWYREQSGFNVWYETLTYNKYTDSNLRFTQAGGVQRAILNTTWNTTSGLTTIVYKIVGVHRLVANN